MDTGERQFLQRKPDRSYGLVRTDNDYNKPEVKDSVDVQKNADLQATARKRGHFHITRLASMSPEQLDSEIKGLKTLVGQQVQGLKNIYGEDGGGSIAKEWLSRGDTLARSGSDRNYRSRARTSFPSIHPKDDRRVQLQGWDETIQTAVVRERARGRIKALQGLDAHPNAGKLAEIHSLMTQSSSLSRVPTAGVAGSLDAVSGTFGAHVSSKELSGGGVGTNPMAHRYRTQLMQSHEQGFLSKFPGASMADIQRVRLATSLKATTNIMSAKTLDGKTNEEVFTKARNPWLKAAAMHHGREAAKIMQRSINPPKLLLPSPPSSPTSTRKTVSKFGK